MEAKFIWYRSYGTGTEFNKVTTLQTTKLRQKFKWRNFNKIRIFTPKCKIGLLFTFQKSEPKRQEPVLKAKFSFYYLYTHAKDYFILPDLTPDAGLQLVGNIFKNFVESTPYGTSSIYQNSNMLPYQKPNVSTRKKNAEHPNNFLNQVTSTPPTFLEQIQDNREIRDIRKTHLRL